MGRVLHQGMNPRGGDLFPDKENLKKTAETAAIVGCSSYNAM
jgi:hypothetical protein